jgi:dipeptidyl-peptidase-4
MPQQVTAGIRPSYVSSFFWLLMTRIVHLVCLSLVFSIVVEAQQQEQLSVERIFQRPSLDGVGLGEVQWAPNGQRFAYLRADPSDGVKELWCVEVSSGKSRVVARAGDIIAGEQSFSREELALRERTRQTGSGITTYQWFPNSADILVPLSGDLYSINVLTGKALEIARSPANEFDPKVAPDGKHVSYVRDGELFVKRLSDGSERQLTTGSTEKIKNAVSEFVAQEEMGRYTGYWWSPDAQHIAYLQVDNSPVKVFHIPNFLAPYTDIDHQEYPKAGEANAIVRLGVIPAAGGDTQWLNLGEETDMYVARVDWLPDSKQLAVQIQSRNQDTLALMFFDVHTGRGRLVLREHNSRWVSLHDDLRFLPTRGEFLWSSERSGFNHLYLYRMDGTLVRQVTNGAWDVVDVLGVDHKAGIIYFSSTAASPVERHVYSVKLDGSSFKRLTTASGVHEAKLSPAVTHMANIWSSLTRPPQLSLVSVDGKKATIVETNPTHELDRYVLPAPEFLSVRSATGDDLNGFIIKPTHFDPSKRYPVILYVYGGPTSQIAFNKWGAGGGMARAIWHRMMAERGYIVFGVDNRGTPARGRAFMNHVHKQLGVVEVEDQLAAAAFMKSLPYVDPDRIMIWGKSYGGYMTCLAMFREDSPFKLGISLAPVTDWRNYDTHYTERYMERPQENPDGYRRSSPVHHAAKLRGKLLLVHGVVDDNVHFQDSMILAEELQKANIQFDFMAYPKSTHAFSGADVGTHLYNLLTRYITENL